MSAQKPPRKPKQPQKLTFEKLQREIFHLEHPPRKLTPQDNERLKRFRAELERKTDADVPVDAPGLAELKREYEQLPDPAAAEEELRQQKAAGRKAWKRASALRPGEQLRPSDWLEKSLGDAIKRRRETGPAPEAAAPPPASPPPQPQRSRSKTRSDFRRDVLSYLSEHREATAREVCAWCDQKGIQGPEGWYPDADKQRQLWVIYGKYPAIRGKIDKYVTRIRRDVP